MTRSAMLRFSEDEFAQRQAQADRRERFQRGQIAIPEREILAGVVAYLKRSPRVAWARRFNTGATKIPEKDGYRFVRFAFKGCSDILGMLRPRPGERVGAFLAIETKRDDGVVSDEQQAFIDTVKAAGGCAGVARSIDEAHELIETFWHMSA